MSFLFGGARPQPSSAEKIAAAEAEIEMVSGMFNQYVLSKQSLRTLRSLNTPFNTDCPFSQARRHLHQEVHSSPVPRSRPQQGRVRLPRPLREQVLRSQRQGFGEDARRGRREAGRWHARRLERDWM
jgi:hypothetical protein